MARTEDNAPAVYTDYYGEPITLKGSYFDEEIKIGLGKTKITIEERIILY